MSTSRILSFKYAGEGILTALKDEPNLKIHLIIALVVLLSGYYFHITTEEWLIVTLCIGVVFALELTNTAIEELTNSFTNNSHPSAKKAKDVAAGAVLIGALTSIIVGTIIFLPYINNYFLK